MCEMIYDLFQDPAQHLAMESQTRIRVLPGASHIGGSPPSRHPKAKGTSSLADEYAGLISWLFWT